jgi:hypothetical protein
MVLKQGARGKLKGGLGTWEVLGNAGRQLWLSRNSRPRPHRHSASDTPDWVELSRFEDDAVDEDDFDAINRGGNQASKPIVRPPSFPGCPDEVGCFHQIINDLPIGPTKSPCLEDNGDEHLVDESRL